MTAPMGWQRDEQAAPMADRAAGRRGSAALEMPGSAVATAAALGAAHGRTLDSTGILALQRAAGNRAVIGALARADAEDGAQTTAPGADIIEFCQQLWQDEALSIIRLGAEVGRLVAGPIGLVSGLAGDLIGGYQDLTSIPTGEPVVAGLMGTLIVLRTGFNVVTNAVGQITAVDQLVQNLLGSATVGQTLSGFGIALDAITIPLIGLTVTINEAASLVKLELTGCLTAMDGLVAVGASFGALLAPEEDQQAWAALAAGYWANVIGDLVGLVNELAGFVTGGVSQSGPIGLAIASLKGGSNSLIRIAIRLIPAIPKLKDFLLGVWNVLGGKVVEGTPVLFPEDEGLSPLPGAALSRLASGGGLAGAPGAGDPSLEVIIARLEAVRSCHQQGEELVAPASEALDELRTQAAAIAEQGPASVEAAAAIQKTLGQAMAQLEGRLQPLGQLEATTADALAQLTSSQEGLRGFAAAVSAIEMPEIEIPDEVDVELGDNTVADTLEGAAEAVVGAATGTASDAIDALLEPIRAMLETGKQAVVNALEEVESGLAKLIATLTSIVESIHVQSRAVTEIVAQLREGMEQSGGLPEMIQALLDEAAEAAGAEELAELPGLIAAWHELGPSVEGARVRAHSLAAGAPRDE